MKFSRQIQLNGVPEWKDHYLDYNHLKKLVLKIEKEGQSVNETSPLLTRDDFQLTLQQSLLKISQFYTEQEAQSYSELDTLLLSPMVDSGGFMLFQEDKKMNLVETDSSSTSGSTVMEEEEGTRYHTIHVSDRQRAIDLRQRLFNLKSFVDLNLIGYSKIINHYDRLQSKDVGRLVLLSYPFKPSTQTRLQSLIKQVEDLVQQLDPQESANVQCNTADGQSSWLCKKSCIDLAFLAISLAVFVCLLNAELFENIEQTYCFAILVFASILWATEVMPLFVTALLVPFLVILFRVIRLEEEEEDGTLIYVRLGAVEATKVVFGSMLSPVIMLLLGGFSLAAALNKYGIAKAMASFVLSKAGTSPRNVLLVNMLVASLASMWISNVAAPVLCLSLIQPILKMLPIDSKFGPCLIMGIALASNLGGIASPIASPQNVIAIQNMTPPPSWTDWFAVSIPLCILGNLIVCAWLMWSYQIHKEDDSTCEILSRVEQPKASQSSRTITATQIYVTAVTVFTILLWCITRTYRDTLGDMGVIAIIPLVAFFGTGILTKEEFNNFLWNVIILAMGGIALGKAVESSGLLLTIAFHISEHVTGLSIFQVLFVFSSLVVVIATFISHTVAALIVLPIVAKIGSHLGDPRLLVMGTAFVCSVAMGLPVSGFPNMTAISQEKRNGTPYLKTKDFLRNGVPCSILVMICICTIGYGLMSLVQI